LGSGTTGVQATTILGLLLICVALSVVPGYGILLNVRRLRPAERMACCGLVSASICGAAALGCFLLGSGTLPAVVVPISIGVGGIVLAHARGIAFTFDGAARQIVLFWLALVAELVIIETIIPSLSGAGWYADWWVHLHRALVYANLVKVDAVAQNCVALHPHCPAPVYDNGVMTARTPLFNLLGGILLGLDHGRLEAFQIATAVWSATLSGPVVLLAQRRGLLAGRIAGTLLLLNPFLVHLAVYTWPKVLTAAFEVAAIYWLCRMRDGKAWAGSAVSACLALAVFTHTGASIYVFAVALYLVFIRRPTGVEIRAMVVGLIVAMFLILPWVGWGIHTYGWRGVFLSSPTASVKPPPPATWVTHKIEGMLFSFIPIPLLDNLAAGKITSSTEAWNTADAGLEFPFDTFSGAQGLIACLLLLRWSGKARLSRDQWRLGFILASCAALGAVLLDPAYLEGGAAVNAIAAVTALGIVFLAALEPVQQHFRLVLLAIGGETLLVFGVYSAYLAWGPWRQSGNEFRLAIMRQRMLSSSLGGDGVVEVVLAVSIALLLGAYVIRRMQVTSASFDLV
jgi:hypothetical protein